MTKHRVLLLMAGVLLMAAAAFAQVGTIDGMVRLPMEGGPAVGAIVTYYGMNFDTLFAQSDSLGHFRFEAVAAGEGHLNAYLPPYPRATAAVHVIAGQTVHPVLVFAPALTGYGRLEGLVLLPFEAGPAAGARVVLFRGPGDSLVTLTDAAGLFAFDSARAGNHDIHATLDGYRIVYGHPFIPDGQTGHITLVLRPLLTGVGSVDGIVLLPMNGGPAVGATVVLVDGLEDSLLAVTDSMGHFAYPTVSVGEHDIYATFPGYERVRSHVHVIDGGVAHITLVFPGDPATGSGIVEGTVMLADATPAIHAIVRLEGHGFPRHFQTETNATGGFGFPHIPAGPYEITAMLPMHGFTSAQIVVADSQTTTVTLVLDDSTHGPNHHHGDTLTTVDLVGTAIVITENPNPMHPPRVRYLIDVDGDGLGDYRLAFGPPWYHPQSGAVRPANGDSITVHGGLLTYATPPVVVVYTINGLFWREPFHGHGGHGGGDHGQGPCRPDSVTRVELTGIASVRTTGGLHGEQTGYALAGTDGAIVAILDFGRPDYVPESGAVRPANGDSIAIVGGQIYCPNALIPLVIVYEINGLLWREPGDTLGFGAAISAAVDEPVAIGAPLSFLTARNYPNPFNPTTTIQYSIPVAGPVTLRVFDVEGREVAVLVNQTQNAGSYAIAWDGSRNASGIYFYRLTAGTQTITQRMTLVK